MIMQLFILEWHWIKRKFLQKNLGVTINWFTHYWAYAWKKKHTLYYMHID